MTTHTDISRNNKRALTAVLVVFVVALLGYALYASYYYDGVRNTTVNPVEDADTTYTNPSNTTNTNRSYQ